MHLSHQDEEGRLAGCVRRRRSAASLTLAFRLAIVLAGLAVSLSAASPAAAARTEFFGIDQGAPLDRQDVQAMSAARVRTDHFLLTWGSVQPNQGSFNWGPTDQRVGAPASRGIRTVPAVWGNPEWVAGSSSTPPIYGPLAQQAWRNFLRALVGRYGPGGSYWAHGYRQQYGASATPLPIHSWEIWNEPNLKGYFAPEPSPAKYARLVQISHDAIKSRDPKAQIVLAGMAGYAGVTAWGFLENFYAVPGIKADFDVAALHPYAYDVDHVRLAIGRFRAVMTNHVDGATPLWITELGWGSAPPDRFGINKGLTGQQQMLTDSFKLILNHRSAWNVQRIFWYRMRDDPADPSRSCSFCASAGLLYYNHSPKPAYNAFKGFTAETTPPQASITSGPSQGSVTRDSTPSFSFSSNEAGSTFICHFDAQPYSPCASPFTPSSPLSNGTHAFFVTAIDAPGNESAAVSRSFTVDTNAPAGAA
jgi:polysaccharide biosynthesis protein PslG